MLFCTGSEGKLSVVAQKMSVLSGEYLSVSYDHYGCLDSNGFTHCFSFLIANLEIMCLLIVDHFHQETCFFCGFFAFCCSALSVFFCVTCNRQASLTPVLMSSVFCSILCQVKGSSTFKNFLHFNYAFLNAKTHALFKNNRPFQFIFQISFSLLHEYVSL